MASDDLMGREEAGGFIELGNTIWHKPLGEAVSGKDVRVQGIRCDTVV